jgi:hypothetical protein
MKNLIPTIISPIFRPRDLKRIFDFRRTGHRAQFNQLQELRRTYEKTGLIDEIRIKRRHRRELAQVQDLLQKPIKERTPFVLDYFKHKSLVQQICSLHIRYQGGRNHHAKCKTDINLLTILQP